VDQADVAPALERASLSELLQLQDGYTSGVASLKARLDAVKASCPGRYAESAKQALKQKGKEHGSGSLSCRIGFAAKYDVEAGSEVGQRGAHGDRSDAALGARRRLFKIVFSVPEAIYKGIAAVAPELREKIDAARTTKIKPPAVTLVKEEA
jgi:hypothetical protein